MTLAIMLERGRTTAPPIPQSTRSRSRTRQALLLCGLLSSLLYLAADILGGMRYEGYRFTSQAISELMAVGAPSERFVDPLFIAYGVLTLAFGVGLLREAGSHNRALQVTAALLIAYAAIGFSGPTLFEMHRRGAGSVASDLPHILLTGVLVLFTLSAMGFAAFALGKRFRVYSFATFLIVIGFGALTAPYAARLAAAEPTPGFGIIERINVYSFMMWMAAMSIALLRSPSHRAT